MPWMNVMPREPPHYNDLIARQQQLMQGPPPPPQQIPQYTHAPVAQHQLPSPRMNKSQSETRFQSVPSPRPQLKRQYNSQGSRRAYPPAYGPVRGARLKSDQQWDDSYEHDQSQMWPHDIPLGAVPDGLRSLDNSEGRTRLVEVYRDPTWSLGINVGQMEDDGGPSGVYVKSLSHNCKAITKGRLNPGDQILEVSVPVH